MVPPASGPVLVMNEDVAAFVPAPRYTLSVTDRTTGHVGEARMRGDENVLQMLEDAVEAARATGLEVTGWTMQSGDDGFAVWLYVEDDEGQRPVFDSVDVMPSAEAAARWCLMQAREGRQE